MNKNYQRYRRKVVAEIEKRLGGKPAFDIDEWMIEDSFDKTHHYTVPAKTMIEDALTEARGEQP